MLLINQTLYFLHRSTGVFVSEFVLLVRSLIFSIRSSGVFGFRLLTKLFMILFTFKSLHVISSERRVCIYVIYSVRESESGESLYVCTVWGELVINISLRESVEISDILSHAECSS